MSCLSIFPEHTETGDKAAWAASNDWVFFVICQEKSGMNWETSNWEVGKSTGLFGSVDPLPDIYN